MDSDETLWWLIELLQWFRTHTCMCAVWQLAGSHTLSGAVCCVCRPPSSNYTVAEVASSQSFYVAVKPCRVPGDEAIAEDGGCKSSSSKHTMINYSGKLFSNNHVPTINTQDGILQLSTGGYWTNQCNGLFSVHPMQIQQHGLWYVREQGITAVCLTAPLETGTTPQLMAIQHSR